MRKVSVTLLSTLLLVLSCATFSHSATPVTRVGETYRGAYVTITGVVARFLDEDEFLLKDDTGSIRVYIGYGYPMEVRIGDKVMVEGFVDFDLIKEIYAWTITTEDGKVWEIGRRE